MNTCPDVSGKMTSSKSPGRLGGVKNTRLLIGPKPGAPGARKEWPQFARAASTNYQRRNDGPAVPPKTGKCSLLSVHSADIVFFLSSPSLSNTSPFLYSCSHLAATLLISEHRVESLLPSKSLSTIELLVTCLAHVITPRSESLTPGTTTC
jgi:hypothetical protein